MTGEEIYSEVGTATFFVDEAGDLTLFDRKGRTIVGNEGVSKFFMVGVVLINSVSELNKKIEILRQDLLRDEYFKDIPSFRPESRKTAICFHAKDDLPEVRREVYKILKEGDMKVQVAIRRKAYLAEHAKILYQTTGLKIKENEIYDDLVKRLFRNLLHKSERNLIYFSRRGKSERTEALNMAIQKAKRNFEIKYLINSPKPVKIVPAYPYQVTGLQIIDYFLWALQRLFEKREERFFNYISDKYRLIMDLDDKRNKPYGEWYSDSNPLILDKIKLD